MTADELPAAASHSGTELDSRIAWAQEVYTERKLAIYDSLVLGVFCNLIWRCPPKVMLRLYNQAVGARHLDTGPGTGYFVDRCRFPVATPDITLLDLSINCLKMSEQRLARYRPAVCEANLMEPLPLPKAYFDSVALNLVLHTIPGGWETKGVIFEHVAACTRPGGVVFGSTVLARGVPMNALTRRLMREQHRRGNFQNQSDDVEGLRRQLEQRFDQSTLVTRGCVGLFWATVGAKPQSTATRS